MFHGEEAATTSSRAADSGDQVAPPAAAASAPTTVSYRLQVEAPNELRRLLVTYLDLSRFQSAAAGDVVTNAELDRLAAASPAQARSLLETEGYFNPQVNVVRSDPPDDKPLFELKVEPGPRTVVRSWEIKGQGPLQNSIEVGNEDAKDLMKSVIKNWPMKEEEPFRQAEWNSAKNEALAQLRSEGYPLAAWTSTEARIDAKTHEAALAATFDSGPLFHLGEIRIEGLQRYDEGAIRNVADFEPGTPYSEKRLLDFQERLGKVGLFESASVEVNPDTENADAMPVIVKVREQSLQTATTGIGFSDSTRERVSLEHTHRRPFGFNVKAHNKFEIGRNSRSWDGDLLSNPANKQYRNLLSAGVSRLDASGEITIASHVRSGRSQETERIERLIYGELLTNKVTTQDTSQQTTQQAADLVNPRTSQAATINYNWVWRDVDNLILPTRGLTSTTQVAGGYARSNFANSGVFTRLYSRNTLYWPLGRSWFTQTRLEYGQVFAADRVGIPDTLMFRAGGDDSVRGYGYHDIAVLRNGVTTSGRKLLTASAEIAHPFTAKRPELWWAAFLDAGTVVDQWSDADPVLGYGLGVRYRSPVGPLRIDWAYGEQVHKGRLHLSVGIAF